MRTNKHSIIWTSIISIMSLSASIVLHFNRFEFASNLLAGIFASGVLALSIAIINYSTERKRTLEKFYTYAWKAASNFNHFDNERDLEAAIDSVLLMNQFDYVELHNAYGDINFIFFNKRKTSYIYCQIYQPIDNLSQLISEVSVHFDLYRKSANGKMNVMKDLIDRIDKEIMYRTRTEYVHDDGSKTVEECFEKQIVFALKEELNGKYFEIMYPFKKEEQS